MYNYELIQFLFSTSVLVLSLNMNFFDSLVTFPVAIIGEDTSPTDGNAKQHFDARIEDGKLYYEKKW